MHNYALPTEYLPLISTPCSISALHFVPTPCHDLCPIKKMPTPCAVCRLPSAFCLVPSPVRHPPSTSLPSHRGTQSPSTHPVGKDYPYCCSCLDRLLCDPRLPSQVTILQLTRTPQLVVESCHDAQLTFPASKLTGNSFPPGEPQAAE